MAGLTRQLYQAQQEKRNVHLHYEVSHDRMLPSGRDEGQTVHTTDGGYMHLHCKGCCRVWPTCCVLLVYVHIEFSQFVGLSAIVCRAGTTCPGENVGSSMLTPIGPCAI